MRTKQGRPLLEIKQLADDGQFIGNGSVFGNRDSYGEIVKPGAFKKSLAGHRKAKTMPKLFWQHDPHCPIGSWQAMEEDDYGLLCTGRLNLGVQKGAEAHALLKAGDIDGLSIGYRTINTTAGEGSDLLLTELALIEVSVVSLPANDQATVEVVKAAEASRLLDSLAAGEALTRREWEMLLKSSAVGLSNAEAERAARKNCLGQGDPASIGQGEPGAPDPELAFWTAMAG